MGELVDKEGQVWRDLRWVDRTTALDRESLTGDEPCWWEPCLMSERWAARVGGVKLLKSSGGHGCSDFDAP